VALVSVGNITAGGTGKTPMTMWLINLLKNDFKCIVVISRGYGRKGRGTRLVSDGKGTILSAQEGGDEPVLIAKKNPTCPVIVSEKRSRGIRMALAEIQPDLVLLDDAFQHRWVYRHCDLVLIKAEGELYREKCLPLGNLREPLGNLKRADIIVMTKIRKSVDARDIAVVEKNYHGPIIESRMIPDRLVNQNFKEVYQFEQLKGHRILAFAGISDPRLFTHFLQEQGMLLEEFIPYPDHHYYSQRDINDLYARAVSHNCRYIITTEKDLVKLDISQIKEVEILGLRIRIELSERERLRQNIVSCIDKAMKNG
jgi:tetraacyldisaccharide 4'-kinase